MHSEAQRALGFRLLRLPGASEREDDEAPQEDQLLRQAPEVLQALGTGALCFLEVV